MKVTATQRLIVEDFPEQKSWIGKMFSVLNDYFQKIQSTINGGIEFGSNITGVEITFDFLYSSHTAVLPLTYHWPYAKKPQAVELVASYIGSYSGNLWDGISSAWDATATAAIMSNKKVTPVLATIAWEYTQEGDIALTDFAILIGRYAKVTTPMSGQKVILRVRATP